MDYESLYCASRKAFSNRAHRGAFRKGALAFRDLVLLKHNPYRDTRGARGEVTWARGYRAAWCDGWYWAQKNGFGRAPS